MIIIISSIILVVKNVQMHKPIKIIKNEPVIIVSILAKLVLVLKALIVFLAGTM